MMRWTLSREQRANHASHQLPQRGCQLHLYLSCPSQVDGQGAVNVPTRIPNALSRIQARASWGDGSAQTETRSFTVPRSR